MAINTLYTRIQPDLGALELLLEARVAVALRSANDTGIVHFACATIPVEVPLPWCDHLVSSEAIKGPVWYWRDKGANGSVHVGWGAAAQVVAMGKGRFASLRDGWLANNAHIIATESDDVRFFFGFSFGSEKMMAPWTDWPNALMTLPQYQFVASPDGSGTITVAIEVNPNDRGIVQRSVDSLATWLDKVGDLHKSENRKRRTAQLSSGWPTSVASTERPIFETMVASTSDAIQQGRYQKAVMARQHVRRNVDWSAVPAALEYLRMAYPENTTFAVRNGDSCFLGASPERLAETRGGVVAVDCLAGTTRRGRTPAEDRTLAQSLATSEKNILEHQLVVNAIQELLANSLEKVQLEEDRAILRLPNVQHLYSRVTGKLPDGTSLFDIAALLHPTPAIGGYPRDGALAAIRQQEPFERGWYSGGVGIIDRKGEGGIAVTLRSALATPVGTVLYAGAGIMADSDPGSEWNETQMKLQPMVAALGMRKRGLGAHAHE